MGVPYDAAMDLRVPGGSSGFLASLWGDRDDDERMFQELDTADVLSDVAAQDVVDALGQLYEGNFEFVGLESEDGWVQTADTRGGYFFERSVADDDVVRFPSVLSAEQLTDAFLRFYEGDVDAGLDWTAAPVVAETKPKRGWFRR